jgi:hypothetical protein
MLFYGSDVTAPNLAAVTGNPSGWLLGFNEPNNCGVAGACMTVSAALALWPQLEATGLKLVCPATGSPYTASGPHNSTDWMADFAAGDANRDGVGNDGGYTPHCDAIAWHHYATSSFGSPTTWVNDLLTKGALTWTAYGKPIWITELGAGVFTGPPGTYPTAAQAAEIVTNEVQFAIRSPSIHTDRWAWYPNAAMAQLITDDPLYANITLSNLDGSLTTLGQRYSTLWQ